MKEERTKTIVNEIRYWKQNRLLPTEYCDFLLALYTQGESQDGHENQYTNSSYGYLFYLWLALSLFLIPLSFLVIYFTEMGIIMQTGLLSSFVAVEWIHVNWLKYKESDWLLIPLTVVILVFLLASITLVQYFYGSGWSLYITLTLNCTLWVVVGRVCRVQALFYSGILGTILLFIYIVL
ncbi:hypothetical protein SAMN04487936_101294 [Halobacillus dabanensis]|uniref:Uncharacterized protein n=1 Tax=Halobacillus dabanensis TaxID=240302 RepID=A0A1I3PF32_HALDA|nr:hypothetical protein SAMN04487936_101294 [Halobacillus dabanensis]